MKVVPLPSVRQTGVMTVPGRLTPGFSCGELRVVPARDLSLIDVGDHRAAEMQFLRDARQVVSGHHAAGDDRKLDDALRAAGRRELLLVQGASEQAKSSVLSRNPFTPPPDPID